METVVLSSEIGEKLRIMETKKIDPFNFEKLTVYQKSLNFVDSVYDLTASFPSIENFGLTQQFRRAACSITLNIGEGSGGTRREFIRFLTIAKRSMRECVACATISFRRKYIDEKTHINLRAQLTEIAKMISGLINYFESEKAKNILSEPIVKYEIQTKRKKSTNYQLQSPN